MISPPPAPAPSEAKPNSATHFVARHPILTKDEKLFGYELLFRGRVENYFCSADSEAASRSTLDTSVLMGLDVLCDGRRAFINCTRVIGAPGERGVKAGFRAIAAGQTLRERPLCYFCAKLTDFGLALASAGG